jgi:hypothetical protein
MESRSNKQHIGWQLDPNFVRVPGTILVLNGTPYGLYRQKVIKKYCPCDLCDLRYICETTKNRADFAPICWPEDEDQKSFFKEDWSLAKKKVREFVDEDLAKFWLGEIWQENERKNYSSRNRTAKRAAGSRAGSPTKRGQSRNGRQRKGKRV